MRWFLKLFFLGAASMAVLVCCKTNREANRTGVNVLSGEESEDLKNRIEDIKKVFFLCPSPAEMLGDIDINKFDYQSWFLNPKDNADTYLDMKTQTLNLGIYITDLAYNALFGRHQETLDYFETVQTLSEKIRVTGAINDEMIRRVKDNAVNLDSLFAISNEAFMNMVSYCEKNSRSNTISLLSIGAFIESLYLAINMAAEFQETDQLINHLAEQKYALDNLVSFAETMPDDKSVSGLLVDMKPIRDIYEQLQTEGGQTVVKKDSTNKLVVSGGKKIVLSEKDFLRLKQETGKIRNKITGNSGT